MNFFDKYYKEFLKLPIDTCNVIVNTFFSTETKINLLNKIIKSVRNVEHLIFEISTKDTEIILYFLNLIESQNLNINWGKFLRNINPEILGKLVLKYKEELFLH